MPQATPSSNPADLKRLGRYRIVRPLSKGGMALVYEARRDSLAGVSPRVAIKVILPEHTGSETFKELFINEARLGASMHHQNLVQIQDFDCEQSTYFLVMEYVEGFTLRRIIGLCHRHNLTIPMGVVVEIGRQACDGLHYAHESRDEGGLSLELVHRDIKPSNLILNPHGVVKVLDFGISKGRLREERLGSVKGTWGYMAPEQAVGEEVGPAADVFGLATVLYELAALTPMFQNKAKDVIRRLLRDDHAARMAATLDGEAYGPLIGVLVRALQRDPLARFRGADSFGRALSALLPDPITARDEVTSFYKHLVELEAGRQAGPSAKPSSEASMERAVSEPEEGGALSLLLTFAVGAVVSLGLLAGVGVLGLIMLGDEPPPPPPRHDPVEVAPEPVEEPKVQAPAPPEEPEEVAATVRVERRIEKPPEVDAVPEEPLVENTPAEVGGQDPGPVGPLVPLMIGAKQAAEVYIGGQFVSAAPVTQELPPGRYSVSLIAMDGRRRTFEVELKEGKRVRRVWDFDRMEWR